MVVNAESNLFPEAVGSGESAFCAATFSYGHGNGLTMGYFDVLDSIGWREFFRSRTSFSSSPALQSTE